jgi:hypothetical protein
MLTQGKRIGLVWAVAMATVVTSWVTAPHAAVICQKVSPKGKVTVKLQPGPSCKGKGFTVMVDLGQLAAKSDLTAASTQIDATSKHLDAVEGTVGNEIGLKCVGAPTRTFAPKFASTSGENAGAPNIQTDGCRAFDGDATKCNAAFETGLGFNSGFIYASSCFFYAGRCFPCSEYTFESDGACVNVCNPPLCPNAPSRVFVGGDQACSTIKTLADCEKSFQGKSNGNGGPQSCFFDTAASQCFACRFDKEIADKCSNQCVKTNYTCASRRGKPVDYCAALTNQADCQAHFEFQGADRSTLGYPTVCYWDATALTCNACSSFGEFLSKVCHNDC